MKKYTALISLMIIDIIIIIYSLTISLRLYFNIQDIMSKINNDSLRESYSSTLNTARLSLFSAIGSIIVLVLLILVLIDVKNNTKFIEKYKMELDILSNKVKNNNANNVVYNRNVHKLDSNNNGKEVVIFSSNSSIEDGSSTRENEYFNRKDLTIITLDEQIKKISKFTFYNCSNLKQVKIHNSLKIISDYAFKGCTSLEYIVIPSSVEKMGLHVFQGCNNLVIFCEHYHEPYTWNEEWNAFENKVFWKNSWHYVDDVPMPL